MGKAWKIALVGLGLLAIVIPITLLILTHHEPRFYQRAVTMPPAQRQAARDAFLTQTSQLVSDIHNEVHWSARFTRDQVNAWLESEFSGPGRMAKPKTANGEPAAGRGPADSVASTRARPSAATLGLSLPGGVHDPRVAFEPGIIELAFRLDGAPIEGVVWVSLRVWVPRPNLIAVRIEGARLGLLPIPTEQVVSRVDHLVATLGLDVEWNEDEGKPVALVALPPRLVGSRFELDRIKIEPNVLLVAGTSGRLTRPGAQPAALTVRKLQRPAGGS